MTNGIAGQLLLDQVQKARTKDTTDESSCNQSKAQSDVETIMMDPRGTIVRSAPVRSTPTIRQSPEGRSYKKPAKKDNWLDTRAVIALIILIGLIVGLIGIVIALL